VAVHGAFGGQTTIDFDVASTQATLTHNDNGSWSVNAGADGTLTLSGVQTLQFTDKSIALDDTELRDDFKSDGKSDFLIENTSGAVDIGEVVNGSAVYTNVASLGPEWKFVGAGDFLGDGKDDFLIENTSGAIDIGEVANGGAVYTNLASLGPEWKFVGTGDYLGEGHDQFLIENTSGAVDIGDWLNGQIHFTQVAALGPEWAFH
jgi:hypothetical protein